MTEQQLFGFALMMLAGILVAFFFDCYRLLRAFLGLRGWAQDLGDLLFWIFVLPLILISLFAASWGSLRFFLIVGAALGVLFYFSLASALVMGAGLRIIRVIKTSARRVYRFVRRLAQSFIARVLHLHNGVRRVVRWLWKLLRL